MNKQLFFDFGKEFYPYSRPMIEPEEDEKEDPVERPIWYPLDGESDRHYNIFRRFLLLYNKRKCTDIMKLVGLGPTTIYGYAKKYNWWERADAFDQHLYTDSISHIIEPIRANRDKKIEQRIKISNGIQELIDEMMTYVQHPEYGWGNQEATERINYMYSVARKISSMMDMVDFEVSTFTDESNLSRYEVANILKEPHDPMYIINNLPEHIRERYIPLNYLPDWDQDRK